jgi:hypothetical protein
MLIKKKILIKSKFMTVQERDLTDEEYKDLYKGVYDKPWDKELLEESKMFLKDIEKNEALFGNVPKIILQFNNKQKIHLKNAIRYWEKKLNEAK